MNMEEQYSQMKKKIDQIRMANLDRNPQKTPQEAKTQEISNDPQTEKKKINPIKK